MGAVRNERIKLIANGLNIAAAGTFVAGVVTPMVKVASEPNSIGPVDDAVSQFQSLVGNPIVVYAIVAAVFLHGFGHVILGSMKDGSNGPT